MVRRSRIVAFLISLALLALEIFWLFLKRNNQITLYTFKYTFFLSTISHDDVHQQFLLIFILPKITLRFKSHMTRRNSVSNRHLILFFFNSFFFKFYPQYQNDIDLKSPKTRRNSISCWHSTLLFHKEDLCKRSKYTLHVYIQITKYVISLKSMLTCKCPLQFHQHSWTWRCRIQWESVKIKTSMTLHCPINSTAIYMN